MYAVCPECGSSEFVSMPYRIEPDGVTGKHPYCNKCRKFLDEIGDA